METARDAQRLLTEDEWRQFDEAMACADCKALELLSYQEYLLEQSAGLSDQAFIPGDDGRSSVTPPADDGQRRSHRSGKDSHGD